MPGHRQSGRCGVVDGSISAAGLADGNRLLAELRVLNDEVEAGALEMERLARLAVHPDGTSLSTARLRFSRALRRHLEHVSGAILPHLHTTANASGKSAIDHYRRLLHDYHEAAAHHVARWPSTSVTADWDGYRHSVAEMLSRLRKRTEVERRDIHPLIAGPQPR